VDRQNGIRMAIEPWCLPFSEVLHFASSEKILKFMQRVYVFIFKKKNNNKKKTTTKNKKYKTNKKKKNPSNKKSKSIYTDKYRNVESNFRYKTLHKKNIQS
jgi:hypothetical protein